MKLITLVSFIQFISVTATIGRNKDGKIVVTDNESELMETFEDGVVSIAEYIDPEKYTYNSLRGSVSSNGLYQWGLDRIDQYRLPLDKIPFSVRDPTTDCDVSMKVQCGDGVVVYVLDTGIYSDHTQLKGKVLKGWRTIGGKVKDSNNDWDDDHGHGTHVASTIVGNDVGVAHCAKVIPVKVFSRTGSGSMSDVILGVRTVIDNVKDNKYKKAIINMSLGGPKSTPLEEILSEAKKEGIVTVVAAGNDRTNSCVFSPSGSSEVITVAASTITDELADYSNWYQCVDIIAPGSDILGASKNGKTAFVNKSGTSMAAPHVSGAYAVHMSREMHGDFLVEYTSENRIKKLNPDTVNLFLHIADFQTKEDVECRVNGYKKSVNAMEHDCNQKKSCRWHGDINRCGYFQ